MIATNKKNDKNIKKNQIAKTLQLLQNIYYHSELFEVLILSSLDHMLLMVSFSHRWLSAVVRRQFIQMTSPKPLGQFQPNFIGMFRG